MRRHRSRRVHGQDLARLVDDDHRQASCPNAPRSLASRGAAVDRGAALRLELLAHRMEVAMTRQKLHHLGRESVSYKIDAADPPLLEVEPLAEIMVETHDARTGRLKKAEEVMLSAPDFRDPFPKTNPATGPIRVRGAEPGDALAIDILDIALDDYGFLIVKPDFGLVRNLVNQPEAKIVQVADGMIAFDRLRFPVRPMVGVLATASAGPPIGSAYCGRHGGNMDNNRIRPGTRVHLPVRVP
ncbi:MAG: hypothetical protein FJX21_19720, partial [Alphaproteobacteria bacterium]|nr:hypothetical protein [Alphaproteobacteria bacterium]